MNRPFLLTSQDSQRLKKQLITTLKTGKSNAIRGSDLAYQLGERDDRRIRVAIGQLIKEGVPIASSVTEPMGYFIVSNEHEAAAYMKVLSGRISEANKRLVEFQKAASEYQVPEQLSLIGEN